jgi:hypothetical protein
MTQQPTPSTRHKVLAVDALWIREVASFKAFVVPSTIDSILICPFSCCSVRDYFRTGCRDVPDFPAWRLWQFLNGLANVEGNLIPLPKLFGFQKVVAKKTVPGASSPPRGTQLHYGLADPNSVCVLAWNVGSLAIC